MSLKWFSTPAELLAMGADQPGTNVFPLYSGPFPLVNDAVDASGGPGPRQDIEMVASRIYKVTVGADEYVTVALCRIGDDDKPQWTMYCGDKQVQGSFRVDGKTLSGKLKAEGVVSKAVLDKLDASEWVAKVPDMAACGFFKMLARTGKFCSHTQAALANTPAEDLEAMETDLRGWKSGAAVAPAAMGPMSAEEEAFYDSAFIQPVLLAGERGAGKTFLARQAADKYDAVYLEMQMHPSMEAWEFRAHDRAWNGKVYTVLGKLAEAVYWIQKGKKVVLCMDEFLNMNPIYATVINSALTLTKDDTYMIETGRIVDMGDGIGRVETVEVPSDMLWVVATSNIGARYNLDKIAPSVRARFRIILMNTNADRTALILEKTLAQYSMPLEFAEMFKKFIVACNQAVDENNLDEEATTRLACNVIRAAHKVTVRDKKKVSNVRGWLPLIKQQLMREIAQVVNFELGPLDPDQHARYTSLVDACFKV